PCEGSPWRAPAHPPGRRVLQTRYHRTRAAVAPERNQKSHWSAVAYRRPRFCRFTLLACLPSAVRVLFGSLEIVLLRLAAAAAFLMFRRAAAFCFADAMRAVYSRSPRQSSAARALSAKRTRGRRFRSP